MVPNHFVFFVFCLQHLCLFYLYYYLIHFANHLFFFFFFFFLVSCSGPDPPALEIGALQAVSGERLGLLPQRWRVFCHRDLKWPSQALQVGNQRNKVKFWLGGFKLMGILYSICQKNDPSGASSQSVPFSLLFSLSSPRPPPPYYFLHLSGTCFLLRALSHANNDGSVIARELSEVPSLLIKKGTLQKFISDTLPWCFPTTTHRVFKNHGRTSKVDVFTDRSVNPFDKNIGDG